MIASDLSVGDVLVWGDSRRRTVETRGDVHEFTLPSDLPVRVVVELAPTAPTAVVVCAFSGGPLDGVRSNATLRDLQDEILDAGGRYAVQHRVDVPEAERADGGPVARVTYRWEASA